MATAPATVEKKQYLMVFPSDITVKPELNPRAMGLNEDNVEEILRTIPEKGIEVPVECRKEADKLVLVFGAHRVEAANRYNKHNPKEKIRIPVIVKEMNEAEAYNRAISENRDRKAMSAIDHAFAQKRLMEVYGWSVEQVAKSYGWEVEKINSVATLLRLPKKIQKMVNTKELPVITAIDMAKNMTPEQMETALFGAERTGTGRIKGETIRKQVKKQKAEKAGDTAPRGRKELITLLEGLTGPAEKETLRATAKILLNYALGKYKDEIDAENRLRTAHGDITTRSTRESKEVAAPAPKVVKKKPTKKAPATEPEVVSEEPEVVDGPDLVE